MILEITRTILGPHLLMSPIMSLGNGGYQCRPEKTRTGYVYYDKERKSWTARITYRDESGKVRNIKRQVENRTEGKQLLNKILREIEDHGEQIIDGDSMTFKKLAGIY